MSEIQDWPSPNDLKQAQVYVPEALYSTDISLSPAVERELAVSGEHYLSVYSPEERRSLYIHDVAYWHIVAENGGDTNVANKIIAGMPLD